MKLAFLFLTCLCAPLVTAAPSVGQTGVTLAWTCSPSPSATATLIKWGPASGNYTNFISVPVTGGPLATNTVTVTNLVSGSWVYFVAVATDGVAEADPSNEVQVHLKPGSAKDLRIISVQ